MNRFFLKILFLSLFAFVLIQCGRTALVSPEDSLNDITSFSNVTITSSPHFSPRSNFQAVSKGSKIYIVAGRSGDNILSDIWTSVNGSSWDNLTISTSFPERIYHQTLVHNNKIYIIGGALSFGAAAGTNEIWISSDDGLNWDNVTTTNPFPPRIYHQSFVYNNKIYVLGGIGIDSSFLSDVWVSDNGSSWDNVTTSNPFSARAYHQALVHNDKIYVLGGSDNTADALNDVWVSDNGSTWDNITTINPFSLRYGHQAISFNNKIYVIGGELYDDSKFYNDVWVSDNGSTWDNVTLTNSFSPRRFHQSLVHSNKVYVIGGVDSDTYFDDVWVGQ